MLIAKFVKYFSIVGCCVILLTNCSKKEEAPSAFPATVTENENIPQGYSEASSTNDPSNDQPVGSYGDQTMYVSTPHNGAQYTLDVEFDGENPSTIYFPKGGHVELSDCSGGNGSWDCTDQEGQEWTVEQ